MCWCGKRNWDYSLPKEQLQWLEEQRKLRLERGLSITMEKVNKWQPLWSWDICPFCKQHIRYYCKNGCILTWEKLKY